MDVPTVTSPERRRAPLMLWFYMVVLAGCWAITIYRLGGLWSALPEYSYGWAVPILCVILFSERWRTRSQVAGNRLHLRRQAAGGSSRSTRTYFGICVAALVFLLARAAVDVMPTWRFAVWMLALSTVALTLLMLRLFAAQVIGGVRFRVSHFAFPVLFFLLAVPWPDRIEGPLIRTLTALNAAATVEVMSLFKVGAVQLGNIILIGPGMIGVQEACSGIRSFQSTLMVALFLGELFRFSFWRRVVFVFLGALLSFAFNIVRTSFLVWACNRDGLDAAARFHDPAGWTILAASVASLGLIGWWLYRGQKKIETQLETHGMPSEKEKSATGSVAGDFPTAPALSVAVLGFLVSILLVAELGTRWWLASRVQSVRSASPDFGMGFDAAALKFKPLKISLEARELLGYDRGAGWEWQGGGAERWQAFYFTWDKPHSLAREIACTSGATVHTPELCFTLAGMQLQHVFAKKIYQANGLQLVFKSYEFNDRGMPIFVFDCLWQRNVAQSVAEEQLSGPPSTGRGIRQAFNRFKRGERGVTDEVRVLKFGVWGPRSLGEAEVAFQQQLNLLVAPKR